MDTGADSMATLYGDTVVEGAAQLPKRRGQIDQGRTMVLPTTSYFPRRTNMNSRTHHCRKISRTGADPLYLRLNTPLQSDEIPGKHLLREKGDGASLHVSSCIHIYPSQPQLDPQVRCVRGSSVLLATFFSVSGVDRDPRRIRPSPRDFPVSGCRPERGAQVDMSLSDCEHQCLGISV